MKPAPYLFSGPNSLYGAFGDQIIPDENVSQFFLKSPLEFVFPKNTFSVWIFVLNSNSPIFLARRTRWHDWGKSVPEWSFVHPKKHVFGWNFLMKPAPYLFSGPNSLYGAFGGKIDLDKNFAQYCLKGPLEFVFPKNTFSVWIFVLSRNSPIFLAKRTRWHDWGQKCQGVMSILKNTFLVGIFWGNRPHTSFLGLVGYMVRSGAKLFRTKTVLNFASKALSNSFFQKTRFRFEFLY